MPLQSQAGAADNGRMKNAIIAAALLLALGASAQAQTKTSPTAGQRVDPQTNTHDPGADRPDPTRQHQPDGHQHVVYWTDWHDHLSIDPQTAADAWSADDLVLKRDAKKAKLYPHRKHKA